MKKKMVNCNSQTRPFLFIFFFSLLNSIGFIDSHGVKLDLIRRQSPSGGGGGGGVNGMKQVAQRDVARAQRVREKHVNRPGGRNVSAEMPINAGADLGGAQYLAHFRIGTPPQSFALIADTGSDLTWMNCRYGCPEGRCPRWSAWRRIFRAEKSSSFQTVPCSSDKCKVDLASLFAVVHCPTPQSPCVYDYRYADGSAALGLFANDTATLRLTNGSRVGIPDVLIGCTQSSRLTSFNAAEGVMGLGYSNYSIGVKAALMFGGKFSYCLVDHLSHQNLSSYLVFGSNEATATQKLNYTAMILGVVTSFYAVNITAITYGGLMLNIPAETWNVKGKGGAVIDSGGSLTSLTTPAYKPVFAAVTRAMQRFQKLDLDIGPLKHCFNSTGFSESVMPPLVFHFADGIKFEPPVKNYVIEADDNVKCLGIVEATWPGPSIIGNIMQQGHIWEYDITNRRIGFAKSSCT